MSALPDPVDVSDLPIDQLGLMMLGKFAEGGGWSSRNLMLELNEAGYRDEAGDAMAEAFAWLGNRGLVAPDPRKNEWTAVTTTRLGQQVLADGPAVLHATERLQEGLHPLIEAKARRQFLMGEYEQAVFVSMKAVEVRVRSLGDFGDDVYGVDLMNKAFNRDAGKLADQTVQGGEREAMRSFFVGAYGVLRNPAGHREIDYDDPIEAADGRACGSGLRRVVLRAPTSDDECAVSQMAQGYGLVTADIWRRVTATTRPRSPDVHATNQRPRAGGMVAGPRGDNQAYAVAAQSRMVTCRAGSADAADTARWPGCFYRDDGHASACTAGAGGRGTQRGSTAQSGQRPS